MNDLKSLFEIAVPVFRLGFRVGSMFRPRGTMTFEHQSVEVFTNDAAPGLDG